MYFFSKNKNLEKTARLRASINQCLHSKIVDASVDVETRLSACRGGGVCALISPFLAKHITKEGTLLNNRVQWFRFTSFQGPHIGFANVYGSNNVNEHIEL